MMTKNILVLIITVAITLPVLAILDHQEVNSKVGFDCVDATERERIRQLAFDGIDQGLVSAMAHLFDVWTKDPQNF